MKRKISLFVILTLIAITVLSACQSTAPAQETAAEEADTSSAVEPVQEEAAPSSDKKVIGLASFQQGNDWNIQVAEGVKAHGAELGWEVIQTNAEADSDAQLTALEGFLSQGVDGVVIPGGSGPALEPIIKQFKDAGIPVVTVDLTSLNATTNIYPDNYMTTELLAVFSVNKLAAVPGKYAHLTVPNLGWKTVDIRDKVADLAFEIEGWELTGILDSGLSDAVNQSMTATRSALLANPDLNLVYSSWGMPAVGAARAIREAELQDSVFVVCTDADRIVLAEMAEDDSPIAAVIGQRPFDMGAMAVDYLGKAFAGDTDIPTIAFAPFYFVTKEPQFLPPGVTIMTPEEAWSALYPDVEFGSVN
jgi:ribose transport system substrate-binding protein